MASRVPSHVYRNRHGTFYFRLVFPPDVRYLSQCREKRFSLQTESRSVAVARALPVIGAKYQLIAKLRAIAVNDDLSSDSTKEQASRLYENWIAEVRKNYDLREEVDALREKIGILEAQLKGTVPKTTAREAVIKAHSLGQSKSTVSLGMTDFREVLAENRFPWPAEKTAMFSELKQAYFEGLSYRGEYSARRPPTKASLSDYGPAIDTFITVMGDMRIGEIDSKTVGQFYTVLKKLPPNINKLKRFQSKSIPEIIEMGEKPQAASNVAKKMERISSMFGWALEERRTWGIDTNPFAGYGLSKSAKRKTIRRPFKPEGLASLLSHPTYINKTFRRSYQFWLVPMGLFTGARLGELCQLQLDDFKEIDGVQCIDLTDEQETKRLKNENAKRLIPIHPELMRMGLLRHVERLREQGEQLLFNDKELSPNHKRGKGHYASKWFAEFRKKVGITEKQVSVFHSFRHTFITRLLDAGVRTHLIAPIVGHEGELITDSVYWGKRDAVQRQPTVDAFKLPDDILSLFPNVEDVTILNLPADA